MSYELRWLSAALLLLPASAQGQALVSPVIAGSPSPGANVDSTAVWVSPRGEHQSLLFVTQKDGDRVEVRSAATGELHPFTPFLGGAVDGAGAGEFNRPNGVWVIYHVPAGGDFADVLIVTDQRNFRVQAIHLPSLEYFGEWGNEAELGRSYGIAWYQDGTDFHVFITGNAAATRKVKKYRLVDQGDRIGAELELAFGQNTGDGSLQNVESVLVDPLHGRLHICGDEGGDFNRVYDLSGNYAGITYGDPQFENDQEGINLYDLGGGRGYLVISDQYTTAPNQFEVFDRATLAPLGNFQSPPGGALVTRNTDGAYLEQRPLPGFPDGAFYPVNNDLEVHIYDWTDVAEAMGLEIAALDRPFSAAPEGNAGPARAALWFHDGSWWGVIPDGEGTVLLRLEDGTFAPRMLLAPVADLRAGALAEGEDLEVLMVIPGNGAQLHRFRYRAATRSYAAGGGSIALSHVSGDEAHLERDSAGRRWVASVEDGAARLTWSAPGDPTSWDAGGSVPGAPATAAARLARLEGALGLLSAGPDGAVFRLHRDADPPEVWSPDEAVVPSPASALAVGLDGAGRVIAAGAMASGAGWVSIRGAAGGWSAIPLAGSVGRDPALAVDGAAGRVHLLSRAPVAGRLQLFGRKAALADLAPGGAGFGPAEMLLAWPGVDMGPALVPRRSGNAASGLVAAAIGSDGLGYFARLARPSPPDLAPPIALQHVPAPDDADVPAGAEIGFRLTDDLSGVDRASIRVLVDGVEVLRAVRGVPGSFLVRAAVPAGAGPEARVRIEAADRAAPPNRMIPFEYRFFLGKAPEAFQRGDANRDGAVDLSDAVKVLFGLFGGQPLHCRDAADADDGGGLAVTDAVAILDHLFRGQAGLPAPGEACGLDPTGDALNCALPGCP